MNRQIGSGAKQLNLFTLSYSVDSDLITQRMIFYKILPGKSQPEDEDDEEDQSIIRLLSGRYIFANGQSLGGTQSVDVLFLKLNTSLFIIIMFTTIHHHRSNGSRTNPHDTRTRRKPTELQRELIICVVLGIKVTHRTLQRNTQNQGPRVAPAIPLI